MNKPFTRGQKARNMAISRGNAGSEGVDASPMPHVEVNEGTLRRWLLLDHRGELEQAREQAGQGGGA